MDAPTASRQLVDHVRARPWGLAVAALADGRVEIDFDAGDDPLTPETLFQIGSVTKTMTGLLLAEAVVRGELSFDTTVANALGVAGDAGNITVLELATQRSGLPRLPPNLDPTTVDRTDPYGAYTVDELVAALETTTLGEKAYAYSNFGFMALGLVLSRALGTSMSELLADRVFGPLGMKTAGCPPGDANRVTGYAGGAAVPWWTTQLPGAGGVGGSIVDVAAYLEAYIEPPEGELGHAIELATTIHAPAPSPMGLGWGHQGGGWFHDGGTGGFTSFVAFHRPTKTAVALIANGGNVAELDRAGFATLTAMLRARG